MSGAFKVNARWARSNRTHLYTAHDKVCIWRTRRIHDTPVSVMLVNRREPFVHRTFSSHVAPNECYWNKNFGVLTENRLEGLLVPVADDIHTSSVDNRTPDIFRARSTGPILSPRYDVTRRDVPHSIYATFNATLFRFFLSLSLALCLSIYLSVSVCINRVSLDTTPRNACFFFLNCTRPPYIIHWTR